MVADGDQPRVSLLGKPECHLCDDARTVVAEVCAELGVAWEERDLSTDQDALTKWWDKIPVTLVDGEVHNYWRVDPDRLRRALRGRAR
ncbi:MAG: glutaredoxin family protein [Streptosporangiales bacterium]|nr:glutaredoxin family protein [Streptosporangiales bacterium]